MGFWGFIDANVLGFDLKPFSKSIFKLKMINGDHYQNLEAENQFSEMSIESYQPPE